VEWEKIDGVVDHKPIIYNQSRARKAQRNGERGEDGDGQTVMVGGAVLSPYRRPREAGSAAWSDGLEKGGFVLVEGRRRGRDVVVRVKMQQRKRIGPAAISFFHNCTTATRCSFEPCVSGTRVYLSPLAQLTRCWGWGVLPGASLIG
jgi:hypothetical protein